VKYFDESFEVVQRPVAADEFFEHGDAVDTKGLAHDAEVAGAGGSGADGLHLATQSVDSHKVPVLDRPDDQHAVEEVASAHVGQLLAEEGVRLEGHVGEGDSLSRNESYECLHVEGDVVALLHGHVRVAAHKSLVQ
jgi:hypothetical protein